MNETLKLVREKVIAAVPEIMELKFGCEVEGNDGNHRLQHGKVFFNKGRTIRVISMGVECSLISKEAKIIGRKIELADVMRAIELAPSVVEYNVNINTLGHLEYCGVDGFEENYVKERAFWNLSLPLDHQSPEVWAFLVEVLK